MSFCELTASNFRDRLGVAGIGSIRAFKQLPSTNSWAIANVGEFQTIDLPALVICDQQTAGRGRSGRQWFADSGTLTFSLLDSAARIGLQPNQLSLLALVAGLSVAEAIDGCIAPITARLKWPNDVLVDGGKVAGILTENIAKVPGWFVVGIGINVSTEFSAAIEEVKTRAQSLVTIANRPIDRIAVLVAVLDRWLDNIDTLASEGFESQRRAIQHRCLLTGNQVSLRQGGEPLVGLCRGIDPCGRLLVETARGIEKIHSGEVVRIQSPTETQS